ncbi:methyltransferase [Actinocatenispora sera]|uniref:Methyltransferase n=1 Tax=Actinocatenispora sera TaxID=390989 RepID=A0A810L7H0_9ACTN|nr:methyltransferase [Actinocatenispora sera]BCJ31474.1 hypothetical protein Asera_55820 [Actinocatenispora sera]
MTAQPRRNADADWDAWPVEQYLAENYRILHPSDAAVIAAHSTLYQRIEPGSLHRTVELGAGPNLYPLLLAAAASRHIDAVEPGAAGVAYLRRALTDGPEPSWQPFYAECRRLNPALPATMRQALSAVQVHRAPLTAPPAAPYDLASMHFVAESVTAEEDEFRSLCASYVAAVRPGGYLVAAFMAGMPTYRLGDGSVWPGLPVSAELLREVFEPLVEDLEIVAIGRDSTLPAYGDDGMLVLHARRR